MTAGLDFSILSAIIDHRYNAKKLVITQTRKGCEAGPAQYKAGLRQQVAGKRWGCAIPSAARNLALKRKHGPRHGLNSADPAEPT